MPLLVGPNSLDTVSINGPCTYEAAAITATVTSPNVKIGGQNLEFIPVGATDQVTGTQNNPLVPCLVPVVGRTVSSKINKTVQVNKVLPAVQGEETTLTPAFPGSVRPIVGPFQHPTVVFNSKNV